VPGHVEEKLRGYLECGMLCFGCARAICTGCGTGFAVAFSCQGRGVSPSCNGRHMAQTAAHLTDRVIPPVLVRQWVISVPKRLRVLLADRPAAVAALSKIFLAEIERFLCAAACVTSDADTAIGRAIPHNNRTMSKGTLAKTSETAHSRAHPLQRSWIEQIVEPVKSD